MKEEALKLAERLDIMNRNLPPPEVQEASAMIRRLVEELDYLKDQISFYELKDLGKQTKPLSGVEIIGMSGKFDFTYDVGIIDFVRAIEERHGIK